MRVVLLWLAGGGLVAVAGVLAQLGRPAPAPPPVPRRPAAVERPERLVLPAGDAGHVEFARQLEHAARLYREECEARAAT